MSIVFITVAVQFIVIIFFLIVFPKPAEHGHKFIKQMPKSSTSKNRGQAHASLLQSCIGADAGPIPALGNPLNQPASN